MVFLGFYVIIELVKSGSDLEGKGCGDVIEGFVPKNQLKSRENNPKTKIWDNFGTRYLNPYCRHGSS